MKDFLKSGPQDSQIVVKYLNHHDRASSKEVWNKPKPKAVEEDEYYRRIEEIIRRDFYPDLVKLDALQQYNNERTNDGKSSSQG